MDAFSRLAPYIREHIYESGWTELRGIQVAACEAMFDTEENVLLASGTASGKTEAAFLPALTLLHERPSRSAGILYIAPLKALINDQFLRLYPLMEAGGVSVCKWHGDASAAKKAGFLRHPQGVMQITPESLESLMLTRREDCKRLFSDLRFVIVDEVHHFMGSPRGVQLLCLLERVQRLCGCSPRRIGLSATLSDYGAAEAWLSGGSGRGCVTPEAEGVKRRVRLSMARYASVDEDGAPPESWYEALYRLTLNRRAIVFAGSRAEAERVCARLKTIAAIKKTPDVYRVHHGSVSAALREEAERAMKASERGFVTVATMTLELGIDIGELDCVAQIAPPHSVSSLVQRIGRCGRRGQSAELPFLFVESGEALFGMDWGLLKAVTMLDLYLRERWIEPAAPPTLPFSLLYQQTMAILASEGELRASDLAARVLTLSAFRRVEKADFVALLRHLLEIDHIEKTERGGLIVGVDGERVTGGRDFFAAFDAPPEYLVMAGDEQIGSVSAAYDIGARFSLAGRTWEVVDVNATSKVLYVKKGEGGAEAAWRSVYRANLDGALLRRMRDILVSGARFAWMTEDCAERFEQMRELARTSRICERPVAQTGERTFCVYPWLGTGALFALKHALAFLGAEAEVCPDEATPVYLAFSADSEAEARLLVRRATNLDFSLVELPADAEIAGKYNRYIPRALLERQYRTDFLDPAAMRRALMNVK